MWSRDWGGKSLPGWYARPQLHSSWSTWSRLGAPAWYCHYLYWWGQQFRCVNWCQQLNRRCQLFFVTCSATAAVNSIDLSNAEIADREIKIIKRYGRLALFPFPRTRILSTSGVAVLCIFQVYLGWVCWRGVYLLFLQLQQLMSACFQWQVTWWLRNVQVSRVTTWRS